MGAQQREQILLPVAFVAGGRVVEQDCFHARVTPGCNSRSRPAAMKYREKKGG
ncbi:hypothetical protein ACFQU7_13805 [Pseudoroseomonas wenyumeiae]